MWRAAKPKPLAVVLKPATRGTVEKTVANTRAGTVEACRRAKLSPGIGGQISKLTVHEGETVKAGQLLLELWNADIAAQVLLARREAVAAGSRSRAVCLKAAVARRTADRLLKLQQNKSVSEDAVDKAKSEADALAAECSASRTEVDVSEARIAVAQAALDRTRLAAPFDGVIAEINGELYEYVTPSPVGIPTPPAVDIIDTTCFRVTAPIDEVDAGDIRVGMPARISMDAFRGRHIEGRVTRIADYVLDVERQARTVEVEVVFERMGGIEKLLPGYSADVEIVLEERANTLRVPTEAVVKEKYVYLFQPDEKAVHLREIRTGIANWDQTEVLDGITPGDLIVVNIDNPGLKDGALATPVQEAP